MKDGITITEGDFVSVEEIMACSLGSRERLFQALINASGCNSSMKTWMSLCDIAEARPSVKANFAVNVSSESLNWIENYRLGRQLNYYQIVTATNAQQPEVESMQELTLTEAQKELKSIIQRKADLESFVVKSMAEVGATVKFDKPERVYNDWRDLVVGDWIEILTSTDRRDDILVGGRYKVNNLEHREHKESGCCVECLILAEGSCCTIWLDNELTTFTLVR